jgi:hypothetical protein
MLLSYHLLIVWVQTQVRLNSRSTPAARYLAYLSTPLVSTFVIKVCVIANEMAYVSRVSWMILTSDVQRDFLEVLPI